MKKIGVLTYFWSDNPGTFLQAYSTCQALKKRFPDDRVELVNYRRRWVYFRPSRSHISLAQWIKDFKRYTTYRKMQSKYLLTSWNKLVTRNSEHAWEFIEKQHYDLVVVGSDTVLQFAPFHFKQDSIPTYWLPPRMRCKKVMCAASGRALTIEQLSPNQRRACTESINSFDFIGVRDEATFALVKDLGLSDESKLKMIPDPTFSYNIDYTFTEKLMHERNLDFSKPTVALHLPRILKLGAELAAYYRNKGFLVLSLGPAKYADINLTDISPFEWAGLFGKCRLAITYRFHDTLFCLKNLVPVITLEWDKKYVTNSEQSKYHSLLKQFGLHQRNLIRNEEKESADRIIRLGDNALNGFDKHSVREKLAQLRDDFEGFIDKIASFLN